MMWYVVIAGIESAVLEYNDEGNNALIGAIMSLPSLTLERAPAPPPSLPYDSQGCGSHRMRTQSTPGAPAPPPVRWGLQ